MTTGCVGRSSGPPSAPIRSTVSIPWLTSPTIAYSAGQSDVVAGHHEELAARCARGLDRRLRHRHDSLDVLRAGRRGIDRAVPRPAAPCLGGIAALDDEVGDDAVEDRVVEEAVPGERDQRCCRVGRALGVEVDRERSAARLEHEPVAHACVERLCRRFVAPGLARSGRLDALALIVCGGRLVVPTTPLRRASAERWRLARARHASRAILSTWP